MAGAQITKVTGNVNPGANQTIAHGLARTPTITILGAGCGANITNGSGHDGTSAKFSNGGGGSQAVNALLIALHSLDADRVKQVSGTCSAGANVIPHGLPAAPDLVFVGYGSTGAVLTASISSDGTNITIPGAGAGDKYDLLLVKLHSLWGSGQWANLLKGTHAQANVAGQVANGASNAAIPHGLGRTPDLVVLGARSGANITLGNPADATNIYVSNGGGTAQNVEALCIAGHSVIA